MDSTLYHRLSPINRRVQLRKLFVTLATIWFLAAAAGMAFWWLNATGVWYSFWTLPVLLMGAFAATLWGFWFSLREDEDFHETAIRIEHRFPELDSSLITAIEQKPRVPHGTLGFLQHETVRRAIYHGYQHSWARIVPQWHLLIAPLLGCLVLLGFLIVLI
ncbi:MAG: hypothetical protein ACR2NP_11910, partial [Pirellulaceae bacterium]